MTPGKTFPRGSVALGLRKKYLPWLACAAMAGIGVPAIASASGEPGSGATAAPGQIQAFDFGFNNPATDDSTVTINAGETVTFSYPSGGNFHNVDFSTAPTSCTQTSGANVGPVPPLPGFPSPQGWAGTCRFNTPGTYEFFCDAHNFMTGTVTVLGAGTPTPTPTATATAT